MIICDAAHNLALVSVPITSYGWRKKIKKQTPQVGESVRARGEWGNMITEEISSCPVSNRAVLGASSALGRRRRSGGSSGTLHIRGDYGNCLAPWSTAPRCSGLGIRKLDTLDLPEYCLVWRVTLLDRHGIPGWQDYMVLDRPGVGNDRSYDRV